MRRDKRASNYLRLLALILCGMLFAGLIPGMTTRAEDDEYPEGMTDAEKQQMLQEMEEDIKADEPLNIPGNMDVSNMTD